MSAPAPPATGASPAPPAPARHELPGGVALALKWIGGVTAVIGLVAGGVQLLRTFADLSERQRIAQEQQQIAAQQRDAGDFPAAWVTLERAAAAADEGGLVAKLTGRLDAQRRTLRAAQEDLAMPWLRKLARPEGTKFADVVDKLVPVLARGTLASQGARLGDLHAHLGWAYFLKTRDGQGELDPAASYAKALQADPNNVWAHAFWGHWLYWTQGDAAQARGHFDAALASKAQRDEVRRLQLAGVRRQSGVCHADFLRVFDEMRREGADLAPPLQREAAQTINDAVFQRRSLDCLTDQLPAAQLLALVTEVLDEREMGIVNNIKTRDLVLALLYEKTGAREPAREAWQRVRSQARSADATWAARADQALRDLAAGKP